MTRPGPAALALTGAAAGLIAAAALTHRRYRRRLTALEDTLTAAQHAAAAAHHAAIHDPLTGLLNRAGLAEQAPLLCAAARRESRPVLVVLGDLDAFKPVNDTYGHTTGDQVLRAVASRLHRHVDALGGLAVRLGGDEFAALLPVPTGALPYAEAWARHTLATLRTRLTVPGHRLGTRLVTVEASLGAALSPTGPDGTGPAEVELGELLHLADAALYAAKTDAVTGGTALAGDHPGLLDGLVDPVALAESQRPALRTRDLRRAHPAGVPVDQAWFWTDEWQAGEREATAQIAAGQLRVYDSMTDLLADHDDEPLGSRRRRA